MEMNGIAAALSKSKKYDDDEGDLSASQLIAAEDLIKALQNRYENGPVKPSHVARAIKTMVKVTLRKLEQEEEDEEDDD